MSKMYAGIQQFFYSNSAHNFPLVETPVFRSIPRKTGLLFDVIMAASRPPGRKIRGRFPPQIFPSARNGKDTGQTGSGNPIFEAFSEEQFGGIWPYKRFGDVARPCG
jgi:hypothetical protein